MVKRKHSKENKDAEQIKEDLEDLVAYIEDFNSFLPIAVCSISPSGDITDINEAFGQLTRYKPLEIIGKPLKTIFLEQKRIEKNIDKTTKDRTVRDRELTLVSKDKKKVSADLSISLRKDKKGNAIGYFASIADITEIKKFQELLEDEVKERTRELQGKITELERFQKMTVGRELKMIELKREIEKLKEESGLESK